jgi:predicted molibdopterin-dependent oxidoreductase YjgC
MTYRVDGIKEKTPDTWVEISPEVAAERRIETGRWVELTSGHSRVRVGALVTDRVQGHELYMPMNSTERPVNRLTGRLQKFCSKDSRRAMVAAAALLESVGKGLCFASMNDQSSPRFSERRTNSGSLD